MSVTFDLPISVWFLSDPWFILQIPCFLCQHFPSIFLCSGNICGGYPYTATIFGLRECASDAQKRGGRVDSCWWQKVLRWRAYTIIMACDSLRQAEAWYWFPVRLKFLQGNGEASYTDHAGVIPHNNKCDPDINLATHMQNGFIHFCCHESTQNRECDQGLL